MVTHLQTLANREGRVRDFVTIVYKTWYLNARQWWEGMKIYQKSCDVIYGRPLNRTHLRVWNQNIFMFFLRREKKNLNVIGPGAKSAQKKNKWNFAR